MMKDLTHFFGSAGVKKCSDIADPPEEVVEPVNKRRRKSKAVEEIVIDDDDDDPPSPPSKRKSKKRKSKVDQNGEVSCDKVKLKKRDSKRKLDENCVDCLSPDVDLTEEIVIPEERLSSQSVSSSKKKKRRISPEMSPDEFDSPTYSPPAVNNSLFKYFSKVDKSEGSTPKLEKPTVLKVKAVVHDPPLADPEEKKKRSPKFEEIKMKLRISLSGGCDKKKQKSQKQEDFDVIVCESIEEPVPDQNGEPEPVVELIATPKSEPPIVDLDEHSDPPEVKRNATKPAVKIRHDGTLASFFTIGNRVPKPMVVLTEEQKQAKQNFLQSGSPANIKKIVASSSSSQPMGSPAPLPKVSHVPQKDPMHIIWNLPHAKLNLKPENHEVILPDWSPVSCCRTWTKQDSQSPQDQPVFDQKKELKQLKKDVDHPIGVWFRYLREMKEKNIGQIWSEKYKPSSVTHLTLAKVNHVEKFQTWLTNLRDCTKREDAEAYDSMDDFIVGDESSDSAVGCRRAALLTGPSGIGKTAVVYAVANELGYQVLELNASANRSGKRILLEFSEALQSHKVEANSKTEFVGKKSKKKKMVSTPPTKSLILIEDADLVFAENDDGFLSTAATLAASSKRPVVFIANEKGCKHLLSKIASHLEIDVHFSPLKRDRISSWLRTVCIAENVSIDPSEIDLLVSWAKNCDIRKCLLQLEFLTRGDRRFSNVLKKDSRTSKMVWSKLGEIEFSSKNNTLQDCLGLLTMTDVLLTSIKTQMKDDNPCQRQWEATERDSTELTSPTDSTCILTEQLVQYNLSFLSDLTEGNSTFDQKPSKRNESLSEMENCLISSTSILSRTAVALDYSPALRGIARSEQVRFTSQIKRNNRYFHYLRPDDPRTVHKMDYELLSLPFTASNSAHLHADSVT